MSERNVKEMCACVSFFLKKETAVCKVVGELESGALAGRAGGLPGDCARKRGRERGDVGRPHPACIVLQAKSSLEGHALVVALS